MAIFKCGGMVFLTFLLTAASCIFTVSCRSLGAPTEACSTLSPNPGPGAHGAAAQDSTTPYEIDTGVFRDPNTGELLYEPDSSYQSELPTLVASYIIIDSHHMKI